MITSLLSPQNECSPRCSLPRHCCPRCTRASCHCSLHRTRSVRKKRKRKEGRKRERERERMVKGEALTYPFLSVSVLRASPVVFRSFATASSSEIQDRVLKVLKAFDRVDANKVRREGVSCGKQSDRGLTQLGPLPPSPLPPPRLPSPHTLSMTSASTA